MILNYRASLIAFIQDTIDLSKGAGESADLQFVDLDAHAEVNELPTTDILGLFNFAADMQNQEHSVDAAFAVMTHGDTGLYRHFRIVDRLWRRLDPRKQEKTLRVYDAGTGSELGWMAVTDGVSLSPMARAETRPLQFIQASFRVDPRVTTL